VKNGFKIIDADSHAMEPEDMWVRYLDKKFAASMPTHKRLAPDFPWFGELNLLGHRFGFTGQGNGLAGPKFVETEDGEDITFFDAAYDYIERGFQRGVLPRLHGHGGHRPHVHLPVVRAADDGRTQHGAQAGGRHPQAYNDWLYDYCLEGNGRLHGVATVDLRDRRPGDRRGHALREGAGIQDALHPSRPSHRGDSLDHPYYDDLWAAVAELGVPLGTHEGIHHKTATSAMSPPST